jgi:type I restriction enzyme S subunit
MIEGLKPYGEYKESGLPWLGQVPGHWEVRRLRASITDCVNGIWGADPNGKDDLICVRVADFDRVNLRVSLRKKTLRAIPLSARSRRLLKRGDLLLEKSGGGELQPVGAVVAFDYDKPAVCSNFVARMLLAAGYDTFYVNYLHSTLYAYRINVRSIKQTTGIQNLDGKAYLDESVAFPPPDEQAAIVRFLDWANGRLERAIRAKRKVIALLNEQKQAIIHRAVTRGLDPSVRIKPSGIRWAGEIPEHWEVSRVKN